MNLPLNLLWFWLFLSMLTARALVQTFTIFYLDYYSRLKMYLCTYTVPHFLKCILIMQRSFSNVNLIWFFWNFYWSQLSENQIQRFCPQDSCSGSWFPLLPHHLLLHLVDSILNTSLTLHMTPSRRSPKRVKCLILCVTTPPCPHLCVSTYYVVVIICFVSGQMYSVYTKNLVNICLLN